MPFDDTATLPTEACAKLIAAAAVNDLIALVGAVHASVQAQAEDAALRERLASGGSD